MRGYLPSFTCDVPRDLGDALARLADAPGQWLPLAGGTDVMVVLAAGHLPPGRYLSIWNLAELRGIEVDAHTITLGGLTTYTDVQRHPLVRAELPMLVEAARLSGAVAIQNRGTLAGNVANASPAADSPPALLAYDATIELVSVRGTRRVRYADYHTGYKTSVRAPDELIARIVVPRPAPGTIQVYRKIGTRKAQAIAKVGLATSMRMVGDVVEEIRLGLSSVAPKPLLATRTAALVQGRRIAEAIDAAVAALCDEVCPIDDVRSTADYRRKVAGNLLFDVMTSFAHGQYPLPAL
ncbi:MAG TPA: xanthine dehydrogenase family protein subunit M [Nannocystaceae bacterium]|nr:xanthine dehydrogenase family protein subunit M [Nannocystaceae bacterium]